MKSYYCGGFVYELSKIIATEKDMLAITINGSAKYLNRIINNFSVYVSIGVNQIIMIEAYNYAPQQMTTQ